MKKQDAIRKLAALGFEIDLNTTGPQFEGGWSGNIDPIGRTSIDGDCFGPYVVGDNASDWYDNAVAEAESLKDHLRPCTDPNCDMHEDIPMQEA